MVRNYEELAEAIVARAVDDLAKAYAEYEVDNENILAGKTITECEQFINSQWCGELTTIHPDFLIKTAKQKSEDYKKSARKVYINKLKRIIKAESNLLSDENLKFFQKKQSEERLVAATLKLEAIAS